MTTYEAEAILQQSVSLYREGWEQTRFISFVIAKTAGSKAETPKEFYPLPWEAEKEKEKPRELTPEQKENMFKSMTRSFEKFASGQGKKVTIPV